VLVPQSAHCGAVSTEERGRQYPYNDISDESFSEVAVDG